MSPHRTGSFPTSLERQYRAVSKRPHCCSLILFFFFFFFFSSFFNLIKENKNNPKFIFDMVAKLTKKQHSPREDGFHFSSKKFINFLEEKIMIIRKQITDSSSNLRIPPKLSCPASTQLCQDQGRH